MEKYSNKVQIEQCNMPILELFPCVRAVRACVRACVRTSQGTQIRTNFG